MSNNGNILISTDYDTDTLAYRGVVVLVGGVEKRFNSGDYDNEDYFNAVDHALTISECDGGKVIYHKSVAGYEADRQKGIARAA